MYLINIFILHILNNLIIEDDAVIAKTIKNAIETWNYDAKCITDFRDVMKVFVSYAPELVLLDISLSFYNGYHWCSEIRKLSKVPIIFISSASDNINIIMAVNMGGYDFISKPFDLNVLTAKVQAMNIKSFKSSLKTKAELYPVILL